MKNIKVISSVLAVLFILLQFSVVGAFAAGESSGNVILETVNLIYVKKNETGTGWSWANRTDTFTMTNLCIDTDDQYGLRLPAGATVVLEGNNVISAKYCAMSIEGDVTFTGSGTLTLKSDSYGMIATNSNQNKKVIFDSGKINIECGTDGIYTQNMVVSQIDKANINVTTREGGNAVNARQVKLLGGKFTANAPIKAKDVKISNLALSLTCTSPAIVIDNANADDPYAKISFTSVALRGGASADEISDISDYAGEYCLSAKVKKEYTATSLFFGDSVAGYWDFVAIAVAILIIAAVIATPYIKHKNAIKKVEAAKAAAREEEEKFREQRMQEKYEKKK